MAAGGGLIGALRVSLSADTAAFTRGMSQAQREASRSGAAIERSIGGIKSGFASLAAGIGVAALAAAASKALDYASSLGEVAQQLGVTTRDLQIYRYAATQVGVSQEDMDKGLAKLTQTMGKAAAGAEAPRKAFAAIGLSLDDLRGATAGDIMPKIADGLAKIQSPAQRAAIEIALFGKAGQKLDTLLSGGSAAINELAKAAEELGVVLSDEQIQNADDTADRLAAIKTVLEARIAGVVSDNADSIVQLANSFMALGKAAAWANQQVPGGLGVLLGAAAGAKVAGPAGAMVGGLGGLAAAMYDRAKNDPYDLKRLSDKDLMRQWGVVRDGLKSGKDPYAGERGNPKDIARALEMERRRRLAAQSKTTAPATAPKPTGGDIPEFLAGGGGGKSNGGGGGKSADQLAADAERKRQQALRDQYNADRDTLRGQLDLNAAQADLTYDVRERGKLAEERLALERAGEELEAKHQLESGDINRVQYDTKMALIDRLAKLHLQKQSSDEEYELQQDMIQRSRDIANGAVELLEMEAGLAETASERREIELRIVAARFALLRQFQQDIIDNERASLEQKDAAHRELQRLDQREGNATEQTRRGTRGPWEEFMSSLPNTTAKANEAFESIAAGGVSSLVDGLSDAIAGAESLGDVFTSVAKQIIADLIKIQFQKAIVGGLSKVLDGISNGGTFNPGTVGSATSAALSKVTVPSGLPKLAGGGDGRIMGNTGKDTNLLSMNGQPIAWVNRGENLSVSPANDAGRGGVTIAQSITFSGAMDLATKTEAARFAEAARQSAISGVMEAQRRRG